MGAPSSSGATYWPRFLNVDIQQAHGRQESRPTVTLDRQQRVAFDLAEFIDKGHSILINGLPCQSRSLVGL
jgi:hypothetical protein